MIFLTAKGQIVLNELVQFFHVCDSFLTKARSFTAVILAHAVEKFFCAIASLHEIKTSLHALSIRSSAYLEPLTTRLTLEYPSRL